MKAGDIVFVRGKTLISKLVRIFDKGEFSHVAIAVSETHILEAQYFIRSRITPVYFNDFKIVPLELTEIERIELIKLAISLVGKWYDYAQILGYLLNKEINNSNYYICSEMIANILFKLGKIENFSEVMNLKPNELYKFLKRKLAEERE